MSQSNSNIDTQGESDVLIVDWRGGLRSKRLSGHYREKNLAGQTHMPISNQAMSVWNDEITHLDLSAGAW